ncbi:chordin-like protein 1 isoform X1 [Mytilus galloprovincialis]|uniref:chordin-like protein 1 isoform X1 n=2 Tax=Mytilus galloprovincialis TaxID=29158 RepID=UPI003F7C61F8
MNCCDPQKTMIWMLTVLILLISGKFLETVESSCTLNNQQYSEGEKWNPKLQIGSNCVECTCIKEEVKCVTTVQCPPVECDNPKTDPRMCCPVCEDFDNIPPTVDIDIKNKGGKNGKECSYHGKKYSHGDIFPSNSSGIIPTSKKQCVNCACTNGNVLCHLKTCNIPRGCSRLIPEKYDCCPKCADKPPDYTTTNKRDPFDCVAHDGVHRNSTEWKPIVNGVLMPCVTCKCLNGEVICERKECPKLKCKRKRKPKGECCQVCRQKRRKGAKKRKRKEKDDGKCKSSKNRNKQRRRGRKAKKERKRKVNAKGYCLINNTKDSSSIINPEWPVLFPKTNKSQSCIFKGKFCLPKKTKYLVYRYFEENSKTFFAFDDLMSDTVEVWFWKVSHIADAKSEFKDSLSEFKIYNYPANWFRQQITDDKIIYGAARKKKLNTFKRRLKRTYQRCFKKKEKRCSTKIIMQEILCADFEEIVRKKCS